MLACLLMAGLVEGIGLSMLVPLLGLAMAYQGGEAAAQAVTGDSKLERVVTEIFHFFNLTPSITNILIFILASVVFKSAMVILAKRQVGYTAARMTLDQRMDLLQALMAAKWEHFTGERLGHLTTAMLMETKQTSEAFQNCILMAAEFLEALVFIGTALLVSFNTSLIAISGGGFVTILLRRFIRKSRKIGKQQNLLKRAFIASMTDFFQSFKSLKAMGREELAGDILEKATLALQKAEKKQVMAHEGMKALQEPLITVVMAAGIYVFLVVLRMPLPTVMILLFLISRVIKQLNKVQERISIIAGLEAGFWNLQKTIHDVRENREIIAGAEVPRLQQAVEVKDLKYSYGSKQVLDHVNMILPHGQLTAIIGPSGAGKTSILDLLAGLIKPQGGSILIDGVSIDRIDLKTWRRMIGYVPQETILFHDTIFNNITLGDKKLSEKDVIAALESAGAMEFVETLPDGIYHVVGERGGKLSGGQRQRIFIARALVHRPVLLMFDEATSALDPASEEAVCETMRRLRGNHTIIAISHQTALLKCADQAFIIANGVAERVCPTDGNRLISVASNGI
jgi:ATP-binding cassette, subfamily C, bacterial